MKWDSLQYLKVGVGDGRVLADDGRCDEERHSLCSCPGSRAVLGRESYQGRGVWNPEPEMEITVQAITAIQ